MPLRLQYPVPMSRGHVELSPSSTSRWWACPGSVAANRDLPNDGNAYTQEGTAAHTLAEMCVTGEKKPMAFLNEAIAVDDGNGGEIHVVVDQEMVESVQTLLDVYAIEADEAEHVWVEEYVTLDALKPPAPMGGTVDFGVWKHRWVRVIDFKYGRGVVVEATNNKQGRTYALGLWLKMIAEKGLAMQPEGFAVTIVQPRAFHPDGPVRTELIPLAEFKQWAKELLGHAADALKPDAPRIPGEHCGFCRFKSQCPELRDAALKVAQVEFADLVVGPLAVRQATTMTPADVGATLAAADILEEWIGAVRQRAFVDLEAGRPIPGWLLKPKRGKREWINPGKVAACLDVLDIPEAATLAPPKLLSPAQMEKVLKTHGHRIPEGLVAVESSGLTLARADDPKAQPQAEMFETVARPALPGV